MRQARTRILSLLLALMMCLSLLPVTALAEETVIIFDAAGGTFSDGSATQSVPTHSEGFIMYYPDEPTRQGYTFVSWGGMSADELKYHRFTSDETVYAVWESNPADTSYTITFDANGGKFTDGSTAKNLSTKKVGDENLVDGFPPDPVREGYTFDGWYRNSPGEYPSVSNYNFTSDATVYANWKQANLDPVRIDFFANGGRITACKGKQIPALKEGEMPYQVDDDTGIDQNSGILWTKTDEFGKLNSIPVAARDGYTFDGWYKLEDDSNFWDVVGKNYFSEVFTNLTGQRLTTSTVNAESATYVAKWSKAAATFTVTFDLNGATGPVPKAQTVAKGETVELPVLKASNAEFKGWGYLTGGTTLTEWKAEYPVTSNLTLYALWEVEGDQILKGLTYRFENHRTAFGYSNSYVIPVDRYIMVFGEIQGKALYDGRAWGGSCYGMAATSGMFFHDGSASTSTFRSGAQVPYDLATGDRNSTLKMNLTEYIEAVFVSQLARTIQKDYAAAANLNTLCTSAKAVKNTKTPVLIGMWGEVATKSGKRAEGGHAVLGYDVVDVSSTERRLMIYDPNFPDTERFITLKKSGSTYTSWAYKMNDQYNWGTGTPYAHISAVPYSDYTQVWNNRANQSNTTALFSTNAQNASLLDSTGAVAATIKNGTLSTSRSDIQPIQSTGITTDGIIPDSDTSAMWLPAGQYTLEHTDGAAQELEATLADVKQSAAVSTSASSVTFAVSDDSALDYVRINQPGSAYKVTLSSTLSQGYQDVQLSGKAAEGGTAIAQISGKLYAAGVGGSTLRADGKDMNAASLPDTVPGLGSLLSISAKPASSSNPFTDVSAGAYYYDAVLWAVEKKITGGTSATTFSPNNPCTRGQIVTFLWRAAGSPKPSSSANPFTDVAAGAYYYDAVLWAVEKGITGGTSATTFSPNAACTRGQTVTFLWRAAGSPKAASSANPFTDITEGAYYYDAVLWAVEKKITGGTSATTFSPVSTVTRGQTVTFLYRSQG